MSNKIETTLNQIADKLSSVAASSESLQELAYAAKGLEHLDAITARRTLEASVVPSYAKTMLPSLTLPFAVTAGQFVTALAPVSEMPPPAMAEDTRTILNSTYGHDVWAEPCGDKRVMVAASDTSSGDTYIYVAADDDADAGVTLGSPFTLNSSYAWHVRMGRIGKSNKVLCAHVDASSDGRVYVMTDQGGGIAPVPGSEVEFYTGTIPNDYMGLDVCALSDARGLVAYLNGSQAGELQLININGAAVSEIGSAVSFGANATYSIRLHQLSDTRAILVYALSTGKTEARIIDIASGTIQLGPVFELSASGTSYVDVVGVATDRAVAVLSAATGTKVMDLNVNGSNVISLGNVIVLGSSGSANELPNIELIDSETAIISYAEGAGAGDRYLRRVDLRAGTLKDIDSAAIDSGIDVEFVTPAVQIGEGRVLVAYSDSVSSGNAYLKTFDALANLSNADEWLALAKTSQAENEQGDYFVAGSVVEGVFTGLVPGSDYHLSDSGTLSVNPLINRPIGKAISSDVLLLRN
ncbi:hypothetical protein [Aliamphritea hakodatensis]|uniref:hypothetical protein n=1 Tax=Aliamphritea hakodatensis TaxID=2895352 RepID=UPI0022FD9FF2|nr:hypothetical protein [Aliamphritea hakodatensis]